MQDQLGNGKLQKTWAVSEIFGIIDLMENINIYSIGITLAISICNQHLVFVLRTLHK